MIVFMMVSTCSLTHAEILPSTEDKAKAKSEQGDFASSFNLYEKLYFNELKNGKEDSINVLLSTLEAGSHAIVDALKMNDDALVLKLSNQHISIIRSYGDIMAVVKDYREIVLPKEQPGQHYNHYRLYTGYVNAILILAKQDNNKEAKLLLEELLETYFYTPSRDIDKIFQEYYGNSFHDLDHPITGFFDDSASRKVNYGSQNKQHEVKLETPEDSQVLDASVYSNSISKKLELKPEHRQLYDVLMEVGYDPEKATSIANMLLFLDSKITNIYFPSWSFIILRTCPCLII